jgi:cell division protein FtsI/penicillin-binding protein 2
MAELRNYERELAKFHLRIGVAGVLVLIGFGLLAARFIFLQVIQHDHYASRAEDNRISIVPIPPKRGLILDRNGIVMTRNYSGYPLDLPRRRKVERRSGWSRDRRADRARFRKLLGRHATQRPSIRTRLSDGKSRVRAPTAIATTARSRSRRACSGSTRTTTSLRTCSATWAASTRPTRIVSRRRASTRTTAAPTS